MLRTVAKTALLLALCGCAAESDISIVITDVTVIDGTGSEPLSNATVLISGNRIAGIRPGDAAGAEAAHPLATHVDGSGKYLIPGLWEMHMHVSLLEGPDILPIFTAYGITGVRDMGSPDAIYETRRETASGERIGPRIVSAGLAFVNYPTPEGHPETWAQGITSAADAPAAVGRLVGRADYVKTQDSFTDRDIWLAIAAEAHANDLQLAAHIPFSMTLEEAIGAGLTSIEHSIGLAPAFTSNEAELRARVMAEKLDGDPWSALFAADAEAITQVDDARVEAIAELMVEKGVAIDANLKDLESMSFAATGRWHDDPRLAELPPAIGESWRGAADSGFFSDVNSANLQATLGGMPSLISRLQDLGVMILAGSDAGAMFDFPGSDLHTELGLLVDGGLTTMEAIQTATINPARYMGMADSLGTIEQGKIADLVLLNADPLMDIGNTREISAVIQNGRMFGRRALNSMLQNQ